MPPPSMILGRTPLPARRPSGARRVTPPAERRKAALGAVRRALVLSLRVAGAASISALIGWGAFSAHKYFTTAATFSVRQIELVGLRHADPADLIARSGLQQGGNLFKADLAAAARGIAAHPWVASVRLHRRLPDGIVAEVREHEPAALVELGALYATDSSGRIFKRATRADALDLPVLTGLERARWAAEKKPSQERVLLALRLLEEWRRQGLPAARLSEVRMDADGGLTLFEGQRDEGGEPSLLEVRIGSGEFATRLARLSQLRAALARRGDRATRIELDLVKAGSGSWATAQVAQ